MSITKDINIIFDTFNKADFEQKIIALIEQYNHVLSVSSRDSFDEPGLQFIDNLCSVIRLSRLDNQNEYYKLIEKNIIEVNVKMNVKRRRNS